MTVGGNIIILPIKIAKSSRILGKNRDSILIPDPIVNESDGTSQKSPAEQRIHRRICHITFGLWYNLRRS
jgi:hypothetical protein